jgi:DNA-binding LacI/PurR family transcriptional regulator
MFFPSPASHRIAEYLDEVSLPWMSINPVDLHVRHNFVMADHIEAGRTVGECFVHLGYERVAVLYDELENASPLEKVTGLYQGYLKNNRSPAGIELVQCPDMEEQSGYDAMRQHLKTHKPPQGIFSTADTLAVGAMRACQEIGLRVPQDLGVVGSTGLPTSELRSDPPLTELRQPVEELGRQLAMCLMEMIRGGVQRISGRRIPSPLVVKESLPLTEEIRRELKLDAPVNIEEMVRHDPYGSAVEEPAVLEAVASSSFGVNSEV